jgi:hypothetical protein
VQGIEIGLERLVEILRADARDIFPALLMPGIDDQNVEPPSSATACSTSDRQNFSSVTSPGSGTALQPSASIRAITSRASGSSLAR